MCCFFFGGGDIYVYKFQGDQKISQSASCMECPKKLLEAWDSQSSRPVSPGSPTKIPPPFCLGGKILDAIYIDGRAFHIWISKRFPQKKIATKKTFTVKKTTSLHSQNSVRKNLVKVAALGTKPRCSFSLVLLHAIAGVSMRHDLHRQRCRHRSGVEETSRWVRPTVNVNGCLVGWSQYKPPFTQNPPHSTGNYNITGSIHHLWLGFLISDFWKALGAPDSHHHPRQITVKG